MGDRRFNSTLVIIALLATAYGLVGQILDRAPRERSTFWIDKISQRAIYDVVVAGDSRVNRGVAPEEMTRILSGVSIYNFGFSGVGLESHYLESVRRLLSPSGMGVIALGITPRSLTAIATADNGFLEWSSLNRVDRWNEVFFSPVFFFFTPQDPVRLVGRAVLNGPRYGQRMEALGWMPGSREPEDSGAAVGEYEALFGKARVSEATRRAVVSTVATWVRADVKVFVFRPPVSSTIQEIEDRISGFDENALSGDMARAGALWLKFPGSYPTFDGHHLNETGARTFSRDLARALATYLRGVPDAMKNVTAAGGEGDRFPTIADEGSRYRAATMRATADSKR